MTHRKRKSSKIKWSLFASFTAVTCLIMILFWVLQQLLLGTVYEWTTRSQMRTLLYEIDYSILESDSFTEETASLAENAGTAMTIYRVDGNRYTPIVAREERSGVLHQLEHEHISALYEKTREENGMLQDSFGNLFDDKGFSATQRKNRILSASITTTKNGDTYFILLDTTAVPVRALFHVMQNQLSFASVILLAVAAGVAFLLARHIAGPIERISAKARKMSKGVYDIDFSEKSYQEIEELSDILNHTTEELSKIDRMQKELIANISHDLRTPLTMIVGYTEVMRDIEGENTPENMQVVIDEATRLSSLVNDLLEISRIQGGKAERKDERFDLTALTRDTVARYERLKQNGGFTFAMEAEGPAFVYADKNKITQVLCNLLNNAINYSDTRRHIVVRLIEKEGVIRTEVIDHGIGIPAENLENIWQRYYRGEKTHRRGVHGSGLGLSIVREILDLHGARYGVSSVVGEGSTFWFELPKDDATLAPKCV